MFALLPLIAGLGIWLSLGASTVQAAPASCPYSGGGPPFTIESYEADESRQLYLDTLQLAAANQLFPDDPEFRLPALKVGQLRVASPAATIPPQILYAVAWVESKIAQAAWEVDWGDLGAVKLSFDCGYGIMQITSSINNDGGLPSRYEALVGSHFAYNIAAGARILAEKWNQPLFPIVGEHEPSYIESWYYALWAYNGWAGVNHPQHPSKPAARGVYGCDEDRRVQFTYQELVLGCVINPPQVNGVPLWDALEIELPDLAALGANGMPLSLDVFYAGRDAIHVEIDPAAPFAAMNMPLPAGASIRQAATDHTAAAARAAIVGQPQARVGDPVLEISSTELTSGHVPLTIHNDGTGLLAWRVVAVPGWLELGAQAGVALGSGYGSAPEPSRLLISASASGVPEGTHRGQIRLEFHYPNGNSEIRAVDISLDKRGAARYEAGRPQS